MPELPDSSLLDQLRDIPGLPTLLAEAEATWRARAGAQAGEQDGEIDAEKPGWRAFEDAFPTFYEFTNRPR
jgi:hypothetical protein